MGIEAAVIGAGASLIGSALDRRSAGKAANKANAAMAARVQAGLDALAPAYQRAQDVRQQALGTTQGMRQQGYGMGMDALSALYGPQMQMQQAGYEGAQKALLAGLPLQRAALMGAPVDFSSLTPARQTYDPNLLAGVFANRQLPQGSLPFAQFQAAKAVR